MIDFHTSLVFYLYTQHQEVPSRERSHIPPKGKRKIIDSNMPWEKEDMLVPRRVSQIFAQVFRLFAFLRFGKIRSRAGARRLTSYESAPLFSAPTNNPSWKSHADVAMNRYVQLVDSG